MMLDLTHELNVQNFINNDIVKSEEFIFKMGHVGTHFDVMDKKFPLEYTKRKGKIINVSTIRHRDICIKDINCSIEENDFLIFKTDFIKEKSYGTKDYFENHPELSQKLINYLIEKKISLVGIDAAGIKRRPFHAEADQYLSDHNIFVIENLDNLDELYKNTSKEFYLYCFPLKMKGVTGLPCRVTAEF